MSKLNAKADCFETINTTRSEQPQFDGDDTHAAVPLYPSSVLSGRPVESSRLFIENELLLRNSFPHLGLRDVARMRQTCRRLKSVTESWLFWATSVDLSPLSETRISLIQNMVVQKAVFSHNYS